MGQFKFNEHSTEDFGLVIQTPPVYSYPERDVTNTHVPGRNGDVVIDNKSYKNVERSYTIGMKFGRGSSYYLNFEAILDWLHSARGSYVRLEDSYDNDVYRLACFQSGGNFENYFNQAGAAQIKFNCKPQRYLKIGETKTIYTTPIINPSNYVALPEITIKNIDTDTFGLLMMTVLDKDGKATSSISFTGYVGELTINSEDQTVYDSNDDDKYSVVSLNGKSFPTLGAGATSLEFKKYDIESSGIIDSYSTLLTTTQLSCAAEYKTYTAIESTNQEKIFIKSYEYIIESHKESYYAMSVQSLISSKCETYTFESFNTLLSRYGQLFQFVGSLEENASELPDWLQRDGESLRVATTGFYMVAGVDKRIRFLAADAILMQTVDVNTVNKLYFYPAIKNKANSKAIGRPKIGDDLYELEVDYQDCPEWMSFSVEYSSGSPSKIFYKRKSNGYYWTDKTWLFGKAQWSYYTTPEQDENGKFKYEIFASLSWNTSKTAFVSISGFSMSTTITFTYKYIDADPLTLPEYVSATEEIVNEETGAKTIKELNKVHFTITDSGTNLGEIKVFAKEAGFYSIKLDSSDSANSWTQYSAGDVIMGNLKGTVGFEVYYLASIPTYSDQEGWPTWLNPEPVKGGTDPLAPTSLKFKILESAYYRVSSGSEDEVGGRNSWGTVLSIDDEIPNVEKLSSDYYYIYKINSIPVSYDTNRCYTYKLGENMVTSETPPEWLRVDEVGSMGDGTTTPKTLIYKVGKAGYYKWDSNTSWIKKENANIGDILLESQGKDDSTIYYMSDIPQYGEFELSELFDITVKKDGLGNPNEIEYKVVESGYYRFNNSTNWMYKLVDDVLFTSKVNESNRIYHLKELEADLSGLIVEVIPRWWML